MSEGGEGGKGEEEGKKEGSYRFVREEGEDGRGEEEGKKEGM